MVFTSHMYEPLQAETPLADKANTRADLHSSAARARCFSVLLHDAGAPHFSLSIADGLRALACSDGLVAAAVHTFADFGRTR
jgi:hypothetical protein